MHGNERVGQRFHRRDDTKVKVPGTRMEADSDSASRPLVLHVLVPLIIPHERP